MKLILSLDGGGTRESFILEILKSIELSTGKKIYELFDFITGVSAGAMLAAYIGLGEYDELYNDFDQKKIFSNPSESLFKTKYSGVGKREEMVRVFGNRKLKNFKVPIGILTSTRNGKERVFSNVNQKDRNLLVADVVDASTAAPVYFPSVQIGKEYYIDGGFICNDPVFVGITESKRKWGIGEEYAVLSFGTGTSEIPKLKGGMSKDWGLIPLMQNGLFTIITNTKSSYNEAMIMDSLGEGNYIRIDSRVVMKMDDVSKSNVLKRDAQTIWKKHGKKLLSWIKDHRRKN